MMNQCPLNLKFHEITQSTTFRPAKRWSILIFQQLKLEIRNSQITSGISNQSIRDSKKWQCLILKRQLYQGDKTIDGFRFEFRFVLVGLMQIPNNRLLDWVIFD